MNFLQSLAQHFAGKPIDWDELEESLIRADLGVPMTTHIIKTLQEREAWSLMGINDVVKVVRQEIARVLPANSAAIQSLGGKPNVVLLLGVNGTGKTTSTAKLARYLQKDGQQGSVLKSSSDNTTPIRLHCVMRRIRQLPRPKLNFYCAIPLVACTRRRI
jgi:signal recognition particle GTPase